MSHHTSTLDEENVVSSRVSDALRHAEAYAWNLQHKDGHWCGEFATGTFPTAEHILFLQSCGIDVKALKDGPLFCKHIFSEQNDDGSWSPAPEHAPDVSLSAECYLALKLLGAPTESRQLQSARSYILGAGGLANLRVLTRVFFAQFGLVPWSSVPQLPAEIALLPLQSPINIYSFWVPARVTVMPMLLMRHHEPLYALPNGKCKVNDYLDELWLDPADKTICYARPFWDLLKNDALGFAFRVADYLTSAVEFGLRRSPFRSLARKKIVDYLTEHQNADGSWAGYLTGFEMTVQALLLEGYQLDDPPIRRGFAALETWMWEDDRGKRIQLSNSPIWDTAMMVKVLCSDGGPYRNDERIDRATAWLKSHQNFGQNTDLAYYIPDLRSGGFPFEYDNPWYPDVDDTAAVALALLDQDLFAMEKTNFIRATEFLLTMQNKDGGWASFDRDSDPQWLHKSPFNDLDNLCDPSTVDITARVLEICGLIIRASEDSAEGNARPPLYLVDKAYRAAHRAIPFIAAEQERDGSWWGRWGINYVFGTCQAITGLAVFAGKGTKGEDAPQVLQISAMIDRGVAFLADMQHEDGGWGELYASYDIPPAPKKSGSSLPSPTSWALMGLLTAGKSPHDPVVQKGVRWLLSNQMNGDGKGGLSWSERPHTGTGFPRKLYIGYKLYQHYFPMMALRKHARALGGAVANENTEEQSS
ncbi:hypothetical protein ACLMJK_004671 [Lecanora helva]